MNEPDNPAPGAGAYALSPAARSLYLALLGGSEVAADCSEIRELAALGMVVPTISNPDRFMALAPRHVERRSHGQALDQLLNVIHRLREAPDFFAGLESEFSELRSTTGSAATHAGELLVGSGIDAAIEVLFHSPLTEVCTAQPGGARPDAVGRASSRERSAMDRGVRFRTLYGAGAKLSVGGTNFARQATETGNQVRTTQLPFERMIIMDDRAALVPALQERNEEGQPRAWLLRDPAAIESARRQFESAWSFATPWIVPGEEAGEQSTALQRQILRGLLGGSAQKVVATSLGISPNWVSQQLNQLMAKLGLQTREQLIAWFLQSKELELVP